MKKGLLFAIIMILAQLTVTFSNVNAQSSPVFVEFDTDTINPGDTVVATLYLGTEEDPAYEIIYFDATLDFDTINFDTNEYDFNYSYSWLADDGNFDTELVFLTNSMIKISIERLDNDPRSGHGKIISFIIVIDNLENKKDFLRNLSITVNASTATRSNGEELVTILPEPVDMVYTNKIVRKDQLPKIDAQIGIYPNPVSSNLYYNYPEQIKLIEIISLDGKIDIVKPANGSLDVSNYETGSYFVRFTFEEEVEIHKILITK